MKSRNNSRNLVTLAHSRINFNINLKFDNICEIIISSIILSSLYNLIIFLLTLILLLVALANSRMNFNNNLKFDNICEIIVEYIILK